MVGPSAGKEEQHVQALGIRGPLALSLSLPSFVFDLSLLWLGLGSGFKLFV